MHTQSTKCKPPSINKVKRKPPVRASPTPQQYRDSQEMMLAAPPSFFHLHAAVLRIVEGRAERHKRRCYHRPDNYVNKGNCVSAVAAAAAVASASMKFDGKNQWELFLLIPH